MDVQRSLSSFVPLDYPGAPEDVDQYEAMRLIYSAHMSDSFSHFVLKTWARKHGKNNEKKRQEANEWLQQFIFSTSITELPRDILSNVPRFHTFLEMDEIYEVAELLAERGFASRWPYEVDEDFVRLVNDVKIALPYPADNKNDSQDTVNKKYRAAWLRVSDPRFWRRRLRAKHTQLFERVAVHAGLVCRTKALYLSDKTHLLIRQRRQHSADVMSRLIATNENDEKFTLQELADKSPSNPVIRRAELMVRAKGLEEYANEKGFIAVFVTLTAPGHMHPRLSKGGVENPKYTKEDAREVHKYLSTVWARTRAQWDRDGIRFFGVRTVEPHHDGTPHWHMLLFLLPDERKPALRVFREHALRLSRDEKGAWLRRFTAKRIDPRKGTAVAYLAKYISKNIDGRCADGSALQEVDNESAKSTLIRSAIRVSGWASANRIRQFQFFGAPSVTIWRETFRLTPEQREEGLQLIYEAVKSYNWANFMRLTERYSIDVYHEIRTNCYGENRKVVRGIVFNGKAMITRVHEWSIEFNPVLVNRKPKWDGKIFPKKKTVRPASGRGQVDALPAERSDTWTRINNYTEKKPTVRMLMSSDQLSDFVRPGLNLSSKGIYASLAGG